ncbi:MAG: kelch repeat-containing protein, partial [Kangiellaceae bacterium]|nr:kelch repeat-containing protein [Kangiellaceae bacterium]
NTWELITSPSEVQPAPGEGACLTVFEDDLYLFGGRTDIASHNQLWQYSVGKNEWTLLSDNKFNSPKALAYSECWSYNGKL